MKNLFKNNYVLIFIVLFAAIIRALNLGYQPGSHPDERGIVMISEDVAKNHYNPKNFHYGHFLYYSLYFTSQGFKYLSEKFSKYEFLRFLSSYDGAFYIGRTYALLASLLTIIFTYLLCVKLFNKRLALLSAFFLATNPFFIQLSRYYTTDIFVTCFLVMCANFAYKAYKYDSYKNYIFSIICASVGFVCKISAGIAALPLCYIFILFLIYNKNYKSVKFYLKFLIVPIVLAFSIMFLLEPFMFFDFKSFIGDNRAQLDMLKGKWIPPYTRQYLNTMPIFYHLKQMFFYTMRPVVFILAILGIFNLYVKTKENKPIKIFLFLLAFPGIILTCGYLVKFPRYLLITYPYFMIFAALGVTLFKNSLKRLVGTIAVLFSLIVALDCVTIYFHEHSYITASKWIYNNVPKGSVIINPHWDDVIPLHLPGFDPMNEYKYQYHTDKQSLNIYEESNDASLESFSNILFKGDYIVFPADRAFRGILDKFDQNRSYSIKILSGLFDGSLGYKKVYVYKLKSFLGKHNLYNDDLADESLTGYDHPKAFVFKNEKKLSIDELKNEIQKPNNSKVLNEVLKSDNFDGVEPNTQTDNKVSNENTILASIFYVIIWIIALDLMSLYILPFLFVAFKNLDDKAFGLFRVLGLVIFSFVVWILASIFNVSVNRFNILLILLSLYFISYLFIRTNKLSFKDLKEAFIVDTFKIEIFYLAIFFIFIIFRFLTPEIIWGEKTMDLGFLNYFIREEHFPCNDPWSIDNKLAYYFFGYFIFGLVHKLFSIPAAYGFNLSLATLAAVLSTSLVSLIYYFKKHLNFSIFAAFSIVILSNFEKFYIYFFDKYDLFSDHPSDYSKVWHLGFDLFWKTSRVHEFSSNAISEYPFWSFIFSDLHPHVMAMPIFVCILFMLSYLIKEEKYSRLIYLFFPITAVSLCMTNTWDSITISVFSSILFVILLIKNFKKGVCLFNCFASLGVISIILFLPFYFYNLQSSDNGIGWVQTSEFHRLDHVFRHFGFWLIPILLGYLIHVKKIFEEKSLKNLVLCLLISLAPCVFSHFTTFSGVSMGIQIFSSILIFIGLSKLNNENIFECTFIVVFALLLSFTELCFIIDRPNTIFKFYIGMWFFISIASILSLSEFFEFKPFRLFYALMFVICFSSSVISYYYMSKHSHIGDEKVKYTLNGIEFLKKRYIDRYNVVSYINSHIYGTPILMENFGPSYHTNTSIPYQKYTGLPIIHGWDHHIFQRGTTRENMAMKKKDIKKFYKTYDKEIIKNIIDKYDIDLVVVGEKELESYDILKKSTPNKFEEFSDIFTLLYSSNNEKVYIVNNKLKNLKIFK